jgi:hypothetical protein
VAGISCEGGDPETILAEIRAAVCRDRPAQEKDYYLDEKGDAVFTAAFHLKRGSCCGNDCRHCPF